MLPLPILHDTPILCFALLCMEWVRPSLSPCLESFGGLASGRRPLLIPTGTQAGTGKPVPNRVPAHTGDLRLEVCTANLFH